MLFYDFFFAKYGPLNYFGFSEQSCAHEDTGNELIAYVLVSTPGGLRAADRQLIPSARLSNSLGAPTHSFGAPAYSLRAPVMFPPRAEAPLFQPAALLAPKGCGPLGARSPSMYIPSARVRG